MIAAALLALAGIGLIAAGTPRQAGLLARAGIGHARRKALRAAGAALLAVSLGVALTGDDRARHIVGWTGAIGVEAIAVALVFTLVGYWRQPT